MKKYLFYLFMLLSCVNFALAQDDPILLTINGNDITRSEFEYIFKKHNSQTVLEKKTLSQYLDLFINFKLKVYAAVEQGLDTTQMFKDELNGYRLQAAKTYLSDEALDDNVAKELYEKMRKEGKLYLTKFKQIFFYLPQTTSISEVNQANVRMDSICRALDECNGDCFDDLVSRYSDDQRIMSVGKAQLPQDFEALLASIPIGSYSEPYSTPQGIHIIKVIDKGDLISFEEVKRLYEEDVVKRQGVTLGTSKRVEELKKEYNFISNDLALKELKNNGKTDKDLFTIAGINYTGSDFAKFSSAYTATLSKQISAFIIKSLLNYENALLETKYPEFKLLMQEYKEGMLLFEISDKKIWTPALADDKGVASYFHSHKSDYKWELPRYNGLIIGYNDKATLKKVKKMLKRMDKSETIEQQKELLLQQLATDDVSIEQGVYAVGDNQIIDHLIFKVASPAQNAIHRFYYLHGSKQKGPSDYNMILGEVMTDYQNFLEEQWVKSLRHEAKVEINQEVLKTVNNN